MPLLLVSETFTQIGMALDRARTLAAAGRQVHEWIERDRSRAFIATA